MKTCDLVIASREGFQDKKFVQCVSTVIQSV